MPIPFENCSNNIRICVNVLRTPSKVPSIISHVPSNEVDPTAKLSLSNETRGEVRQESVRAINSGRKEVGANVVDGFD
jgi:hypothetical protein